MYWRIVRFRHGLAVSGVTAVAMACLGPQSRPVPSQHPPSAWLTDTLAVFAFPHDTVASYTWDALDGTHYPGDPLFYWEVSWHPAAGRDGVDPAGLSLVVRWVAGGPRTGTLEDMLTSRTVSVETWCAPCTTPAVIVGPDSGVGYRVDGRQLLFVVAGAAAIRRVFPQPPDTVTLSRGDRTGRRAEWTVAVSPHRR